MVNTEIKILADCCLLDQKLTYYELNKTHPGVSGVFVCGRMDWTLSRRGVWEKKKIQEDLHTHDE